jgi:protein-disulfide isomerase
MPPRKKPTIEPTIEPLFDESVMDPEDIPEEQPEIVPEDTVTFKRSHFYAVLTVLAFAAGVLLGYVAWGMEPESGVAQSANPPAAAAVVEAPPTEERQFQRYSIPVEDSYTLGPADAPITLVEFSDYQCPYCRRWHDEVYEPLLAAYPGKIKFVYRHLPLTSIHPDAFPAAEAAMCAGEQDAYWQFHEKLFGNESLGRNNFVEYARDLGLDVQAFEACVDERKYQEQVQADVDFAVDLGIRSTPTFFINGLAIVGAQPLDVFKQVIDKELAGEIPR